MIKKQEAEKLAILWLEEQGLRDIEYIVVTKVFEKPYGYVLTYQDKRYLEHNDKKYLIFASSTVLCWTHIAHPKMRQPVSFAASFHDKQSH